VLGAFEREGALLCVGLRETEGLNESLGWDEMVGRRTDGIIDRLGWSLGRELGTSEMGPVGTLDGTTDGFAEGPVEGKRVG
jgi:hypothetical protein